MTLTLKNLDGVGGGVVDGTVPTAANLGASGVLHAGGGTMTGSAFRTAAAQEGSLLGVVLALDNTGSTIINFVPASTTLNQISFGMFLTGPYGGTLSAQVGQIGIRHASGFIATLTWETSGNILFRDGAHNGTSRGTVVTGLTRSSTQWYYASIVMNNGSGTAAYTVKIYDVTAGFTQVGSTFTGSTAFTSTAAIAQIRIGSVGTGIGAGNSMGIDQIRYDDGGTTELLPASPNATVNAVLATVTIQAYAPAVTGSSGATVNATVATMAFSAIVGAVPIVDAGITVPAATVTVQAYAPSVTTAMVRTATGGVTLSGSAATFASYTVTASGGLTLTGSASTVELETATATGGVTLSGTGVAVEREITAPTGGLTLSGTATAFPSYTRTATSGVTLGGTSTPVQVSPVTATGGITLSGAGDVAGGAVPRTATGGVTLSGTATVVEREIATATSGLTLSGTATATASGGTSTRTGTGGVTLSGTAAVVAYVVLTGQGNITLGGSAVAYEVQTRTALGTFTLGGVGGTVPQFTRTANGTIVLGGYGQFGALATIPDIRRLRNMTGTRKLLFSSRTLKEVK